MCSRGSHFARCSVIVLTVLPLLSACSGEGGRYAGSWKRDLYGEGEVRMNLASNGGVELTLPVEALGRFRHEEPGHFQG